MTWNPLFPHSTCLFLQVTQTVRFYIKLWNDINCCWLNVYPIIKIKYKDIYVTDYIRLQITNFNYNAVCSRLLENHKIQSLRNSSM